METFPHASHYRLRCCFSSLLFLFLFFYFCFPSIFDKPLRAELWRVASEGKGTDVLIHRNFFYYDVCEAKAKQTQRMEASDE